MKQKIQISVIMACYNTQEFLSESIESILNQTFRDFELIIIDDKSNDNSLGIAKKYAGNDSRIKIIENETNSWAAFSRNQWLKVARWKYIAILDSDDIAISTRLEKQYNYLETHPSIYCIWWSFQYIDETSDKKHKFFIDISFNILENSSDYIIKYVHKIHTPTIMFRNEWKYFYREKLPVAEDRDLWLNMLTDRKIIKIFPEILNYYRMRSNSLMNSKKYNTIKYFLIVDNFFLERIRNGIDNYANFDFSVIQSIETHLKWAAYIDSKYIKFHFISDQKTNKEIRQDIYAHWKKYGFMIWKNSWLMYFCCFNWFTRNMLRKIIIQREWLN